MCHDVHCSGTMPTYLNKFDIFALLSCTGLLPVIVVYKYISILLKHILVCVLKLPVHSIVISHLSLLVA